MNCKKLKALEEANRVLLDALFNATLAVDQENQKYKLAQDSLNKSESELGSIKHIVLEYRLNSIPTEKDMENLLTALLRILRIK